MALYSLAKSLEARQTIAICRRGRLAGPPSFGAKIVAVVSLESIYAMVVVAAMHLEPKCIKKSSFRNDVRGVENVFWGFQGTHVRK